MHTLDIDGIKFHYNSDLSGDVLIRLPGAEDDIAIPGEALIKFFFELPTESVFPLARGWAHPITNIIRAIEPEPKLIIKTWSDDE